MRQKKLLWGALLVLCSSSVIAEDWIQLGNTPQRWNYSKETIAPPYVNKWAVDLQAIHPSHSVHAAAQVIICEGKAFIGCKSGTLFAFDAKTGKQLWVFKAKGAILGSAGYDSGKVYISTMEGKVYAISADLGKNVAEFTSKRRFGFSCSPLIAGKNLFVIDRDGRLFSLSLDTLKEKWHYDSEYPVLQSPAYDKGVVFFGDENMQVHAVDSKKGKRIWLSEKFKTGISLVDYYPVLVDDLVLLRPMVKRNSDRKSLYILNALTGKNSMEVPHYCFLMSGPHSPPAVTAKGNLVVPWRIGTEWHSRGWALQDLKKKKVMQLKDNTKLGIGALDETMAASVAGDIIFSVHHSGMGWGNPDSQNGAFNVAKMKWYKIPRPKVLGAYNCTQAGGANAISASNGLLYHQAHNVIYCFGPK